MVCVVLQSGGAPSEGDKIQQRVKSLFQPNMKSLQEAQLRGARPVSTAPQFNGKSLSRNVVNINFPSLLHQVINGKSWGRAKWESQKDCWALPAFHGIAGDGQDANFKVAGNGKFTKM